MAAYSEKAEKATDLQLSDAHFHLGFVLDLVDFAADAQRARSLVFAASVTPGEYRDAKRALRCALNSSQAKAEATIEAAKGALRRAAAPSQQAAHFPFIKLAVGLHPWWVSADEGCLAEELRAFDGATWVKLAWTSRSAE